jgi:hypothetical protein
MKKLFLLFALCMSAWAGVQSQIVNKVPLSPRITGYNIDAKLDPVAKTITGTMDAFWVNKTDETIPDIQLHMYMNAFKSRNSTRNKESGGSPGKDSASIGRIDIKSMTTKAGEDLLPLVKYIQPDDKNKSDSTVIRIILNSPVKPGDTVSLKIMFVTKLPSQIRRTGYTDDFYFVAQWFPKFGVYEPAGMRNRSVSGWNCHQFHANSEFYAYHSVYDVKTTVPKDYVVGTGGMLLRESTGEGNTKVQVWRAEDIVDFAWTAWPGYALMKDTWRGVNITLLIPKTRVEQAGRQFTAVKNALEYLDKYVGPYPWPHLTFVDPPPIGSGAGGMEYTTLFTSDSFYGVPSYLHFPEMVTVHEFGHAYFMGILGSNEFEEPWLDEGVNSFWEERIMDHYWGENSGIMDNPLLRVSDKSVSRMTYVTAASRQAVSNNEYSWNYPHGTYSMMSYEKTATWLYTLMGIIGEDAMNEVFREYYRQWSFKHPSGKDFVAVTNQVVSKIHGNKFGPDMNWFFDETLYGTGICDYKIVGIATRGVPFVMKKDSAGMTIQPVDSTRRAGVLLERAGDVIIPVDILVHFRNGEEKHETWDGKSRFRNLMYYENTDIEWAIIDPEYKNRMDVNFVNNSMTNKPDRVPVRRFSDKIISFMQFLTSIVTL